jgi:RNA polymerase sigma-70 factor (ECF subfamily)
MASSSWWVSEEGLSMPGEVAEIALMTDQLRLGESAAESSTPLARLIERARGGDAAAFDQIMICHERRVMALAWRMLGSEDDARDAVQEVFLRVYRHLHKFDTSQDFAGWLYRITINVCHDLARKRGFSGRMISFEAEYEQGHLAEVASPEDTETTVLRAQQQAIIARALATLSEKERAALVLRDLEGLATEEVARILGSSQTTVRSQISSARAKIKLFRDRYLKRGRQG